MPLNRALLVGIDKYETFQDLTGCSNDVAALAPLFERHADGARNFDLRTLSSASSPVPITASALLEQVTALLAPGADVALFYFAGHAANVNDELYLVTADGTAEQPGLAAATIFELVFQSKVPEIVLVLDCCFSGRAGQVTDRYREGALLRNGLSLLASSRADEPSAENDGRGFFSVLLCEALEGAARDPESGWVTLAAAHEYITRRCGAWDQQPVLKVNVIAPCTLRRCAPASSQPGPTPHARKVRRKWMVAAAAVSVLIAVVVIALLGDERLVATHPARIACADARCSQDAVTECPKGTEPINRCEHTVSRGSCELSRPESKGRNTRVHVEAERGARCSVKCWCRQ